jgi:hypothetical protein
MTKEIHEQVKSTKRRLEFVKRHNVGHKILLVKDVQKLLEIVDTQARQIVEGKEIMEAIQRGDLAGGAPTVTLLVDKMRIWLKQVKGEHDVPKDNSA